VFRYNRTIDPYVATPAQIEAFQRRADLQLAALLVALVLIPGAVARFEGEHGTGAAVNRGQAPARPPRRTAKGRHVRPPRSC
jgi:hypothetical protein